MIHAPSCVLATQVAHTSSSDTFVIDQQFRVKTQLSGAGIMASSSNSPCAACKFLRRKCTSDCVFAPYFPPDQPLKFANAHRIFGASNISKILNDVPLHQREDAVNSLAYEAEARIRDPVYGCVGAISYLKRHIAVLEHELTIARSELARYMGTGVMGGVHPHMGTLSTQIAGGMNVIPQSHDEHILSTMPDHMFTRSDQNIWVQGREEFNNQLTREQLSEQLRGGQYDAALVTREMMQLHGQQFQSKSVGTGDGGSSASSGEGPSFSTLSSP